MVLHLLLPEIHVHFRNCLQASTTKPWSLAHEDFLCSLECFSVAALLYWLAVVVGCIEKQQDIPKQNCEILCTMETCSFAIGRPRHETKLQKRERLYRIAKEKRRNEMRKRTYQPIPIPIPTRPSWLLLPSHITKGFGFWLLTLKGDTYLEKRATLLTDLKRNDEPIQCIYKFDTSLSEQFRRDYKDKALLVMDLLYQNQCLRWIFKRFFTRLRIQRFQVCNEVDPITMDGIKESIQVPLFSQRKIYRFEATPFLKHLHNRLVHCDGHISRPQPMKNPLTNEVFTTAQLMSLLAQAKRYGYSSWAIEAFSASQYNLSRFMLIYTKPLRLHALKTTMANVTSWDSTDTLFDFIKSQHMIHEEVFRQPMYTWAVHKAPYSSRIVSWRKLCVQWYEMDILVDDFDTKERILRGLEAKTLQLCDRPHELEMLRNQMRKANSPPSSDGSRSL
jgi:hypothetical protein